MGADGESSGYKKMKTTYINNLREQFSPGPGFERGSPALRAGALIN